jgi:hypothetical protein
MTIDWLGRGRSRRIEALEREVALLRGMVADQPPPEDPRVGEIKSVLADLERRVAEAEHRIGSSAAIIAEQTAASLANAELAQADRTTLTTVRVELIRLDKELTRHEEETRRIATGLLEQIHRHR